MIVSLFAVTQLSAFDFFCCTHVWWEIYWFGKMHTPLYHRPNKNYNNVYTCYAICRTTRLGGKVKVDGRKKKRKAHYIVKRVFPNDLEIIIRLLRIETTAARYNDDDVR